MRRILSLMVVVLMLVPAVGAAQEADPPEGAMLIILDASGSMNTVDENGIPYIDKAKEAILELVDALPDGMLVGLRVYGHREPNTDAARGCQDTELISPVAPLDRDGIRNAIGTIEASGFTPIGLSLQEAVADLPDTGPRSIVLISDGEDTCAPPDPCQIAEELFGDLVDVRIESVGFLIDTGSAAEQQLRCIADVTGGRYTSVHEPNALVAGLGEITEEIMDWRPPLTLNGALDQQSAPVIPLAPKADWVTDEPGKIAVRNFDSILMPGETRWYQLDLWERESVWVWTELEWPADLQASGVLETIILDAAGNRVEAPVGHGEVPLQVNLSEGPSPTGATIAGPQHGSPQQGSYLVGFRWDAPSEVFLGSLHVSVEVIGDDAQRYMATPEIEGSLAPEDAPVLSLNPMDENEAGWRNGQYRGPLASGETRWYRMEMNRGEIMNVFALFPGDRYVGDGAQGEFSIVLSDLDGNPIGGPFVEWPQLSQSFGPDRHQATVSGTTPFDDDPATESVLIGFQWDGEPGQQSEIRFEAEAIFDPDLEQRAGQTEQSGAEEEPELEGPPDSPPQPTDDATSAAASTDDGTETGGLPAVLYILIGVVGIGGAVVLGLGRLPRRGKPD